MKTNEIELIKKHFKGCNNVEETAKLFGVSEMMVLKASNMQIESKIKDLVPSNPEYKKQTAFLGSKTQSYFDNEKNYGTFVPKYEYNLALRQEGFNCRNI